MARALVALLVFLLGGCSWLSTSEYFTCEVEFTADECKDCKVKVFGENANNEDSKEAENPL